MAVNRSLKFRMMGSKLNRYASLSNRSKSATRMLGVLAAVGCSTFVAVDSLTGCAPLLVAAANKGLGIFASSYPMTVPECLYENGQPLSKNASRLAFKDFSVLPPQGDNWCIQGLDKNFGGIFLKNPWGGQVLQAPPLIGEIHDTLGAMVMVFRKNLPVDLGDPSALEHYLKNDMEQTNNPAVQLRLARVVRDRSRNDALCFRSARVREGKISGNNPDTDYIEDRRGVVCRHPSRALLVALEYSERYLKGSPPSTPLTTRYRDELEAFITSLQFVE